MPKKAKGYFGNKSRLFRYAKDAVERAGKYAYRDRRKNRIPPVVDYPYKRYLPRNGINYSNFMHGLKLAGIEMDRKQLSELAINEAAFLQLIAKAKELNASAA